MNSCNNIGYPLTSVIVVSGLSTVYGLARIVQESNKRLKGSFELRRLGKDISKLTNSIAKTRIEIQSKYPLGLPYFYSRVIEPLVFRVSDKKYGSNHLHLKSLLQKEKDLLQKRELLVEKTKKQTEAIQAPSKVFSRGSTWFICSYALFLFTAGAAVDAVKNCQRKRFERTYTRFNFDDNYFEKFHEQFKFDEEFFENFHRRHNFREQFKGHKFHTSFDDTPLSSKLHKLPQLPSSSSTLQAKADYILQGYAILESSPSAIFSHLIKPLLNIPSDSDTTTRKACRNLTKTFHPDVVSSISKETARLVLEVLRPHCPTR